MVNILVVDDDVDLLEMVTIFLRRANMQVHGISDAGTLFDILDDLRPDIILMDIYLGSHDGRNLCRILKASEKSRRTPVILYSAGHITAASIEECLADAFIAKPFKIEHIITKIRSLTD